MIWKFICKFSALAVFGLGATAQEAAIFGTLNQAGTAAQATGLPDGQYEAGGSTFVVRDGKITPLETLAAAQPGRYELGSATRKSSVSIKADHKCVSGTDELTMALMAIQTDGLATGLTLCLTPGLYDPPATAFMGLLSNNSPSTPLIVTSAQPENRARLRRWIVGHHGGEPQVGLALRGLDFLFESPERAPGQAQSKGHKNAITLGLRAPSSHIVIEDVRITGSLREARAGGEPTENFLNGIRGRANNIVIANSLLERLTHGINLSGEDIAIVRNRIRHHWGDFLQLAGQKFPTGCKPTSRVLVKDNIVSDHWSNFRLHPDVMHFFAAGGVQCGLDQVVIEGNIAYMGEALRQPAWPTNLENMVPIAAPVKLDDTPRRLWKITGRGDVYLPPAVCPQKRAQIGIQLQPGAGPITLRPTAGQTLRRKKVDLTEFTMSAEWETWRLICDGKGRDRWRLQQAIPAVQGVFTNAIPGPQGYTNVVVRNNIFWLNAVQGVSFRGKDHENIVVESNSLLTVFPGDTDGDGRANTTADGFGADFSGPRIYVTGKGQQRIENNVSSKLPKASQNAVQTGNDDGIRSGDGAASMLQRFHPTAPGPVFSPQTPRQAVNFARPRSDGPLAGWKIGAVATLPEDDWYDWSWVPDR